MSVFSFLTSSRRRRRAEEARRQKEREEKYRAERNHWKKVASSVRDFASRRYIKGAGLEIGGLHRPLPVFGEVTVKYVDRLSTEEIRKTYPEVAKLEQVRVDIVDDGERLGTIPDESQDFVIANHMLEHTRNPIETVRNFLRVLRPGGVVFMAIPDKRHTFDRARAVTPFEHLRRDYEQGPEWSDRAHYEDWATLSKETLSVEALRARVDAAVDERANIHFHVWTQREISEMFTRMRSELGFPLEIEMIIQNGHEVVTVLRKT